MGLIVEGIRRVKPQVDFIVRSIPKVDVRSLQEKMEKTVYDCFRALMPLSYEHRVICKLSDGDELCLGEWIRIKYSEYQKYGSIVDDESRFFTLIREYGYHIKPWVRKPIKRDFTNLVDLAVKLKPYVDITVETDIPETVVYRYRIHEYDNEGVVLMPFKAKKISISFRCPTYVTFMNDEDGKDMRVTDEEDIAMIEDIVDYVVELYRRADAQIAVVREHNEKVLEEMRRIAEPWKLTNIIKNGGF
jgi:hypothetical protein